MSDERYRVLNSKSVEDQFLQVMGLAEQSGLREAALRSARWIMEELSRTPHEFGESRWITRTLFARCAIVRPILVEYAIHHTEKIVFLRRFAWVQTK
jgi:hypothetical protein